MSRILMIPVVLLLSTSLRAADGDALDPSKKPPFLLSIAMPKVHNNRSITFTEPLPVVLVNTSSSAQRYWRNWCSWGYYNLTLEIKVGIKTLTLTKAARGWTKNYPDAAEISPGGSHIYQVKLGDGNWKLEELKKLLKVQPGKAANVKIRAVYHVAPDNECQRHKVWVGTVTSTWLECTMPIPGQ